MFSNKTVPPTQKNKNFFTLVALALLLSQSLQDDNLGDLKIMAYPQTTIFEFYEDTEKSDSRTQKIFKKLFPEDISKISISFKNQEIRVSEASQLEITTVPIVLNQSQNGKNNNEYTINQFVDYSNFMLVDVSE